ncbi:adenosine kinase [Gregarina niphandrodes]|uniref:Adenosine kinase n=1 Tax=Gregarina niphandrodes TaxID=110365 RepID=A0A023B9N2_GRENI|nr:adenosine kinase [Gregarina niphandrodes]EZG73072.1 adenosine kinase [Gregarina niphandrodes]|eukprot:XP_011129664.1 adenosine kinase [Gregarina niphandrodes]
MIACAIFCNPILDLIKGECSDDWYQSYNLSKDGYQMYDADKNNDLFDTLINDPCVIRLPGGSGQNTARMLAACLKGESEVAFVGCVGGRKTASGPELDPYASVMKETAESIPGLRCYYDVSAEEPTGTCAVSIAKENRSLCTRLGATAKLGKQYVESLESVWRTAQVVCVTGFFVTADGPSMRRVASTAHEAGRTLVLTLSAPFIVDMFTADVKFCAKLANILIGNESEWEAFRNANACKTVQDAMTCWTLSNQDTTTEFGPKRDEVLTTGSDVDHPPTEHPVSALPASGLPDTQSPSPALRLAVCTRGDQDTWVTLLTQDGPVSATFPVPPVSDIVDTNGCGDAFLGGLIAVLVQKGTAPGKQLALDDVAEALGKANACARLILGTNGFDFRPEQVQ